MGPYLPAPVPEPDGRGVSPPVGFEFSLTRHGNEFNLFASDEFNEQDDGEEEALDCGDGGIMGSFGPEPYLSPTTIVSWLLLGDDGM